MSDHTDALLAAFEGSRGEHLPAPMLEMLAQYEAWRRTRPVPALAEIGDLIDQYWDLAYVEGEGRRTHDTKDSAAQEVRHRIDSALAQLAASSTMPASQLQVTEAMVEKFLETKVDARVGYMSGLFILALRDEFRGTSMEKTQQIVRDGLNEVLTLIASTEPDPERSSPQPS